MKPSDFPTIVAIPNQTHTKLIRSSNSGQTFSGLCFQGYSKMMNSYIKQRQPAMKFNLVFSSLLAIALTSGITAVGLSAQPNPNNQQIAVQTTCLDTWKLCVGAIAGLVGGRNLTDDDQTDEE
jgi:hypothetical protein